MCQPARDPLTSGFILYLPGDVDFRLTMVTVPGPALLFSLGPSGNTACFSEVTASACFVVTLGSQFAFHLEAAPTFAAPQHLRFRTKENVT